MNALILGWKDKVIYLISIWPIWILYFIFFSVLEVLHSPIVLTPSLSSALSSLVWDTGWKGLTQSCSALKAGRKLWKFALLWNVKIPLQMTLFISQHRKHKTASFSRRRKQGVNLFQSKFLHLHEAESVCGLKESWLNSDYTWPLTSFSELFLGQEVMKLVLHELGGCHVHHLLPVLVGLPREGGKRKQSLRK